MSEHFEDHIQDQLDADIEEERSGLMTDQTREGLEDVAGMGPQEKALWDRIEKLEQQLEQAQRKIQDLEEICWNQKEALEGQREV